MNHPDVTLTYRGSVSDLATDLKAALPEGRLKELIEELRAKSPRSIPSLVDQDKQISAGCNQATEAPRDPVDEVKGYLQQVVVRSHKSAALAGFPWHEQQGTVYDLAEGALIALKRLRDPKIATPCPACHHTSLFIGSGGHLICSWLGCQEPSVEEEVQKLQSEVKHQRLLYTLVESFISSTGLRQELTRYFEVRGVQP